LIVNGYISTGCTIDSNESYIANNLIMPNEVKLSNGDILPLISIANVAFKNNLGLTSVLTLGKKIQSIGSDAFFGCAKIEKIVLPKNISEIGSDAFYDCSKLLGE
jgi:hypothetical protein